MLKNKIEQQGQLAATLTLVEIGLGSLLHSFHIPFSGHILSINQSVLLTRASFKNQCSKLALSASITAALLKSLSPAGKKLTPMLAILTQGFLTSLGLTLFGLNYFGLLIASVLSASWAFIQPALIMYFIFGNQGLKILEYYNEQIQTLIPGFEKKVLAVVFGLYLLKSVVTYLLSIVAINLSDVQFEKAQILFSTYKKPKRQTQKQHPAVMASKDLCSPLFVISLGLTIAFLMLSQTDTATIIWSTLRPIAIGYLIFYFFRVYSFEKIITFLKNKKFKNLALSLEYSIKQIQL